MQMKTLVITGVMAALTAAAPLAAEPVVKVDAGTLGGVTANGVDAFKGVPFAAPPVGALRWRAPQPVPAWSGVKPVHDLTFECIQTLMKVSSVPLRRPTSEDCLYLNVWRPAAASAAAKLPVIVWIHGGGFVNGGTSPASFDGEPFARDGVIMVSINYRLGRLGYFSFPELVKQNPDRGLLGNYGYMDQLAALKWVRRNIAAFGGNPENVTVFGQSAGGGSVHFLLGSPAAAGLFKRVIIESGGGRGNLMGDRTVTVDRPGQPSLSTLGVAFARKQGITGTGAAALAALRALPAEALNNGLNMSTSALQADTYGGPAVDGVLVRASPAALYAAGRQHKIPVIIGATNGDVGLMTANTKDEVFATFGSFEKRARAIYDPSGDARFDRVKALVGMDRMMSEPARLTARLISRQGVPVYQYRFSYVADSKLKEWTTGAPHSSEVPYVMKNVISKYGDQLTPKDAAVAEVMHAYWVNFAKTGNPNGPGLPVWSAYKTSRDELLEAAPDGKIAMVPDAWKARLDVIAESSEQAALRALPRPAKVNSTIAE